MPTTADWKVVRVPADHPVWNAIDDDDWNGATFANWLRNVKGASVILFRPSGYPDDNLGRFLWALMRAGAERIIDGAAIDPTASNRREADMSPKQIDALVSWLREQAEDGSHQPPSDHGQRFTEAADYIESTVARLAELEVAIKVDLGRADRDAIYRHDLKALAADGASDGCHTDVGTIVRNRLSAATAKVAEAESCYIQESSRNCNAERELRDALLNVLGSATPHPVEHPTMWRTWRQANVLLDRDPDTHVVPTADKDLERRLMSGGRP